VTSGGVASTEANRSLLLTHPPPAVGESSGITARASLRSGSPFSVQRRCGQSMIPTARASLTASARL
jgi:hypothetical protein